MREKPSSDPRSSAASPDLLPRGSSASEARSRAPGALPGGQPQASAAPGRRDRQRQEIFESLVGAARQLLFHRDLDDVKVIDITEAADVGKGTFFNYFSSKQELMSRLLALGQVALAEAVERVEAGQQTPMEALTQNMRAYLCPATGGWLTWEKNVIRALLNDEARARLQAELSDRAGDYEALIRLGQQQGSVRKDVSPRELATLVRTFVNGVTITLWMEGTRPTEGLVDEAMGRLTAILQPAAPAPSHPVSVPRQRPKDRSKRAAALQKKRR